MAERGDRPRVRAAALAVPRRGESVPVTRVIVSQGLQQRRNRMVRPLPSTASRDDYPAAGRIMPETAKAATQARQTEPGSGQLMVSG
jgi:hypothetical protein